MRLAGSTSIRMLLDELVEEREDGVGVLGQVLGSPIRSFRAHEHSAQAIGVAAGEAFRP